MTEEQARFILRTYRLKPDPLGIPRNPLAVYLLGLCIVAGIPLLFGVTTAGSLEAALVPWVVHAWGAMLVFGGTSTLLGMYWVGDARDGLLLKRVGMLTLTLASTAYTMAIMRHFGVRGLFPGGIVAGFAVACYVQFRVINNRVRAIIDLTQQQG